MKRLPTEFTLTERLPKPPTQPAIARIIAAHHEAFTCEHGIPPPRPTGKEAALVKRMVETWGESVVLALVREFFSDPDPWAAKRGWTLAALHDVAPRLLTRRHALDEKTAANLQTARRACEPR